MKTRRALFLTPEEPKAGSGGGGLRSASLLAYLQNKYDVQTATFSLRPHSRSPEARIWRNVVRLARGRPPLFDRFSGYDDQITSALRGRYAVGVVEHFWCASYAPLLRSCCGRLVLDLHNIESELARTHARAARWPASWASRRFADAYKRLEHEWLPQFDVILTASEEDRRRVDHPDVRVFPNALPETPRPCVTEADVIMFSGNLEYHPNVEAVRWFRKQIWPRVREMLRNRAGKCRVRIPKRWRHSLEAIRGFAWWVPSMSRRRTWPKRKCASRRCFPEAERASRSWKPGPRDAPWSRPRSAPRDWAHGTASTCCWPTIRTISPMRCCGLWNRSVAADEAR